MLPSKNIIDNAVNSANHITLVAAVKAAGLVETLKGDGPFTVFAPTNAAFSALPAGTVDSLLRPENEAMLTRVLSYHVVAGDLSSAELAKRIREAGGSLAIATVAGAALTAKLESGKVMLYDEKSGIATVTIADVDQSNSVIHVIDAVVLPDRHCRTTGVGCGALLLRAAPDAVSASMLAMSDTTTRGIRVVAESRYEPHRSSPGDRQFFFSYRILIENTGRETAQLLSRRWVITDDTGRVSEVEGAGVVGETPVLGPGDTFEYSSFCPLETPVGTMEGHYLFEIAGSGERFRARIDPFTLAVPGALN